MVFLVCMCVSRYLCIFLFFIFLPPLVKVFFFLFIASYIFFLFLIISSLLLRHCDLFICFMHYHVFPPFFCHGISSSHVSLMHSCIIIIFFFIPIFFFFSFFPIFIYHRYFNLFFFSLFQPLFFSSFKIPLIFLLQFSFLLVS